VTDDSGPNEGTEMAGGVVAGIAIGVVGTVVGGLILAGILAAFRRMRRSGIRATYVNCLSRQAASNSKKR
jgi:hypothetical protein